MREKVELFFTDKLGRIALITIVINSLKLSLCNIYAPNNQTQWTAREFLQERNKCIIDKAELTTLIVGGDWNCTLSRNDKVGGKPWKATNYRNLILTTMDIFDLIDIQRVIWFIWIKSSKTEIKNWFFFGCQMSRTIRKEKWNLFLNSTRPQSNLHFNVVDQPNTQRARTLEV